jgi:tRNA nucleotidyltransferase (CCA-adding enzyme)
MNRNKNKEELIKKVLERLKNNRKLYSYVDKIIKILVYNNYNFYFVGGTIRDILISVFNNTKLQNVLDIDIVIETKEYDKIVSLIRKNLYVDKKVQIKTYPQFFTMSVLFIEKDEIKRIDLSIPRKEEYLKPAALPKVSVGTIFDDIFRRDFTINAICLYYNSLTKSFSFYDPFNGIKDIIDKKIRVLHKNSFIDDPTRILRGIRFVSTIGFKFDIETEKLIKEAIEKNMLSLLSQHRLNLEFVNILKKGKNLTQIVKLFKKYQITRYYENIQDLLREFMLSANKIELKKIENTKIRFYIRLLYLLEKVTGGVGPLETNKIGVFKEYLVKLDISRDERQPIYEAVKIFAYGKTKTLPKWIKIYLQVFKKKIIKLPVKPSQLVHWGIPKEKIKPLILYLLKYKIRNLSKKKIKSITLKLD